MHSPIVCSFCGKSYSIKGIATHIWRSHGDGINHKPSPPKIKKAWNKGLSKESDERVLKQGKTLSNRIKDGDLKPSFSGKKHSEETITKMRRNSGGYRIGSGKGKKGIYEGIKFDSTWELAWYIYNKDIGLNFKRCDIFFEYEYKGRLRKYYPDFILDDNRTLIEIKGFLRENDIFKFKCVDENYSLKVITEDEITVMIEYVKEKFNVKKIEDLYENNTNLKISKKQIIIDKIIKSGVNFEIEGWITKLSQKVGMHRNTVIGFIRRNIPELYEKCYQRNKKLCLKQGGEDEK